MRIHFGNLAAFLFLNALVQGSLLEAATERYWLTFSGEVGVSLMQIDNTGRILRSPTLVPNQEILGNGFTGGGITKNGPNKFNLWGFDYDDNVVRVTIDRTSFRILDVRRTNIHTANRHYFQVTQKGDNNFLAIQKVRAKEEFLFGYGISPSGIFTGNKFYLSRLSLGTFQCLESACAGGVTADGRVAFYGKRFLSTVFLQSLGDKGQPAGRPVSIRKGNFSAVGPGDVTNRLPNNKRFAVYVSYGHEVGSLIADKVVLQPVNASTHQRIGKPKLLLNAGFAPFLQVLIQGVAIDPMGKFVIISAFGNHKPAVLLFQALDTMGAKSGTRKILLNDAADRLDILKE